MKKTACYLLAILFAFLITVRAASADEHETIWLEAEHFVGIEGHCWPLGDVDRGMIKTDGHWGLSGPGWAAEWNQGGESGFMSIAVGPEEKAAAVKRSVRIPTTATYYVWVRYSDWREQPELFEVKISQADTDHHLLKYGQKSVIEEDNEMKLYWGWAFAWDHHAVELQAGDAEIQIMASSAQAVPRQIDVVVLTTDANYSPLIKERPASAADQYLDGLRKNGRANLKPLAKRNLAGWQSESVSLSMSSWTIPQSWQIRTVDDQGFLYLWNVSQIDPLQAWLSQKPDKVKFPYNMIDDDVQSEFESMYGGKDQVPIFSDPRITPTFHGVGAGVFATDESSGDVKPLGIEFSKWLDHNPDRKWAMLLNYHPGQPIGPEGIALFEKYRDRFVGSLAGESLGYFYPKPEEMRLATESAKTRRQLVEDFKKLSLDVNAAKYRAVYDRDLDANPYADVIACHSVGSMAFVPICFDWGAQTVGYESSASTSSLLGMRWAFMRGAARQHGGLTATYRSCNFGDSSTIFSNGSSYTSPQNIFDNYYSVYSGAGMTWYKFDIWYQYMAGSSMFYHEQGFDEFWKPGGLTAAGKKPVQLSPKGKLVDRFLRITTEHPDRGSPVTPVAFLVDYAHGWEPASFWPNSFVNWHQHADRFLHSNHEQMLQQWFWAAYFPIGPQSEKPMTALNEVYVAGIFGDIFDCIFAYPDVNNYRTIDTYPVAIALGEIELTVAEGKRINEYVKSGGTLLISLDHLSGPGVNELSLPDPSERRQASSFVWEFNDLQKSDSSKSVPCERFLYSPINVAESQWQSLATTESGDVFCAFEDRGKGRIVVASLPYGLTISGRLHPVSARLLAHLSSEQMPIEVEGEVEWLVNQENETWYVTLLNPAGQDKPQQGITPTDYGKNQQVTLRAKFPIKSVVDWLAPDEQFRLETDEPRELQVVVPAGAVRILEIK